MPDNILTVECAVPNNTWYFDIIPSEGWSPRSYWIMCIVISYVFSLLIATVFYLISSKNTGKDNMKQNWKNLLSRRKMPMRQKQDFYLT